MATAFAPIRFARKDNPGKVQRSTTTLDGAAYRH